MLLLGAWTVYYQEVKRCLLFCWLLLFRIFIALTSTNCSLVIFLTSKPITWLAFPETEGVVKSLRIQLWCWWDQLMWVIAQGKVFCGVLPCDKDEFRNNSLFYDHISQSCSPRYLWQSLSGGNVKGERGRQTGKLYDLEGIDVYQWALHHFRGL